MPPLPKKKRSHANKGKRWSHLSRSPAAITNCSNCHNPKPSHRICPTCGYYGGRQIIATEAEEFGDRA